MAGMKPGDEEKQLVDSFDLNLDDGHVRVGFVTALSPEQNEHVGAMLSRIETRDDLESLLAELQRTSRLFSTVAPPRGV